MYNKLHGICTSIIKVTDSYFWPFYLTWPQSAQTELLWLCCVHRVSSVVNFYLVYALEVSLILMKLDQNVYIDEIS